ncbi:hypothetical protein CYJ46_01545 [Corynebacterium coyleae]|uniref:hypothetical protein n=1 Tax=Corynebacterium coyleae TaxID=53374 RepID=UPI000C7561FE|nr:hypothetical protein [Corynebacterium coyleae]PLA39024.1 hypothetical protein CYJ46_01545 [Corynebacterium coyleae]
MPQPQPITIYSSTIHVSQIQAVAQVVDTSGAVEMITAWVDESRADKHPGGAKPYISIRTALMIMLALGVEASPLLITEGSRLICGRLSEQAWEEIGLAPKDFKKYDRFTEDERRVWYHRLRRTLETIFSVVDPYPETSNYKRKDKDEYERLKKSRNKTLVITRKKRAHVLMNALIEASRATFGQDRLSEWKGDVCVDGTSTVISRKGNTKHSTRTAADADAGWYVREGDHKSDGYDDKRNVFWGYESTLVSMFGSGFGSTYPALIAGIGFDRPGKRISEKALWAMDNVIKADTPSGHFVGDRAYFPNAAPQNLQIPLRQHGYKLVGDYKRKNQQYYGIQGTHAGAVLLDGVWFCPSISAKEHYVNAREKRDNGEITDEEYTAIVEDRKQYALASKGIDKSTGNQRFACPAKGKCPSVSCSLAKKIPSKQKDVRKRPKALLPIQPVHQPTNPGQICTQGTITIPLEWEQKTASDKRSSSRGVKANTNTGAGVASGEDESLAGAFDTVEDVLAHLKKVDAEQKAHSATNTPGDDAGTSEGSTPRRPRLKTRARKVTVGEDGTGSGVIHIGTGASKVGTFAKLEQQGPHHGSKAWHGLYGTGRNVIETRNSMLKNHGGSGVGLGASTTRLLRGWVKQFFLLTVGAVSVNVRLIQSWLRGEGDPAKKPTGRGPGQPPKQRVKPSPLADVATGNDPPMVA